MMAPFCYYKQNASHLLDFDTSNDEANAFAIAVSFMLQSMSNLAVGSKKNADDGLGVLEFNYAGRVCPRMRFFVEVVLIERAGGFVDHLRPDPEEASSRFVSPGPAIMHQVYRRDHIVGFRFHWIIFDKTLHPATLMKTQIHMNQFEKNVIDWNVLCDRLDHHVQNRGFHEYVKKAEEKKAKERVEVEHEKERLKKEREEQKKAAAGNGIGGLDLPEEDEGDDNDFAPNAGPPIAAAINAAMAVAEAHNQDSDIEEEEEEEVVEEMAVDNANSEEDSGEMEVGDPLSEAEEERLARIELEKLEGKKNSDQSEARISKKADANGMHSRKRDATSETRAMLAADSCEPTTKTYWRLVQSYPELSKSVYHVYNCAGNTEASRRFRNGIYETGDGGILKALDYDLHNSTSPLFYLWTFSFAVSVDVAMRHVPGYRQGFVAPILAEQADAAKYDVAPNGFISFPFPDLVFEYVFYSLFFFII
jgi:hypothetical protein